MREAAEGKPVRIGLLQRHAIDAQMATGKHAVQPRRADRQARRRSSAPARPDWPAPTRWRVAGHEATIFEKRDKPGGLNEYGIAAYKTPDDFAAREVDFILSTGGISVKHGVALGRDVTLEQLRRDYDAVFLGVGLGVDNKLGLPGEKELANVIDAVDYIAELRQAKDLTRLPVGRRVVVIGGGMTAIDAAVQSKRLGAESVTIVYRRGVEHMKASAFERELAQTNGVVDSPMGRSRSPSKATATRRAACCSSAPREEDGKLVGAGERLPHRGRRRVHRHRPEGRPSDPRWRGHRAATAPAASSSTPSGAPACRACGRAATAFPAAST